MAVRRSTARLVAALLAIAALAVGAPCHTATAAAAAPCWAPPVEGPVVDPYRAPACPYCAGNRGVDYATIPGRPVRAVAAGVVTFAGPVAGTRHVVVEHVDGVRATYGGVAETTVAAGARVVPGAVVGWAAGRLHFGLRAAERDGGGPIDPTPFLGTVRRRPRLVPVDGAPPRAAPPARLVCPDPAVTR